MAYQLIAVDMDGTLLNSKKEITPRTAAAVTQALARGYHVVMATGRCYRQIAPYMRRFPAMRYAITSSGAVVMLIIGIFVVWMLLDAVRYSRYRSSGSGSRS